MDKYQYSLFFEANNLTDKDKKTLRKYFQKSQESGGGKCGNIERIGGNTYRISFKKKKDQELVLQKKDHKVTVSSGNLYLSVTPDSSPQTVYHSNASVPIQKDVPVEEKTFKLVEEEFTRERHASYPQVKICISTNMIILEGPDIEVFSAAKKLDELMKKIMKKTVNLPKELISFIKSSDAIFKYQARFQQSLRHPVSLEVGSDLVLSSLSSDALNEAEAAILRDLRVDTVQLHGAAAVPPDLDRGKEILTKAKNEENRQGVKVETSFIPETTGTSVTKVQLVGYSENVNKLKEVLHDYEMNHVTTKEMMDLSPELVDCFDNVLDVVGMKQTEVTFKASNAPYPHVLVSGPRCLVLEAQRNLRTSLDNLVSDTLVVEGAGAQRFFQAEGKTNMELVESACKVIIRPGQSVQSQNVTTEQQNISSSSGLTSLQTPQINLEIRLGDLKDQKVDVIVGLMLNRKLTSTEVNQCLSEKSGDMIRRAFALMAASSTVQPGDVLQVYAPPSLGCSKIFFIECLPWDGVRGQSAQALGKGLRTCLDLCVQQGWSSVAFSVTGPGLVLKYPLKEAIDLLTENLHQFALSATFGSLSTIHVVFKPGYANTKVCYHDVHRLLHLNLSQGGQEIFRSVTSDLDDISMTVGSGVNLTLVFGNITKETTDGIVNPTDFVHFNAGSVCHDILTVAGPEVEAELKKAKVNQGGVVVTHPGLFPCEAILHVYEQQDAGVIEQLACNIIEHCETFELMSVAIPAICAGTGAMDPGVVAEAILRGINTATSSAALFCLTDIRLVLTNINVFYAFKEKAMHMFPAAMINRAPQLPHVEKQEQQPTNADASILCSSSTDQQSVFQFLGLSTDAVSTAMTRLRDLYQAQSSTHTFTQEQLEGLTQDDVNDLKHLVESQGLYVQRDQSGQGLTVSGLKDGVSQVMHMVNGFLQVSLMREMRVRDEDDLYPRVAWVLGPNGNWERLPKTANYDLENNDTAGGIVDAQGNSWSVNLQAMEATKQQTGHKTKLKRLENHPDFTLPLYWDNMTTTEAMKLVALQPSSAEYRTVIQAFQQTVTKTVTKIERVQNVHLRRAYEALKKQISDKYILLGGAGEKLLYHGTSQDNCSSIMKTGFNRSFAGQNATVYGHGTYFAVDASYSSNPAYAKPAADGSQLMFVARVLTGTYTVGRADMKVPPPRNAQQPDDRYDSLVDNMKRPRMYVVFHDSQAYPDYLITFK